MPIFPIAIKQHNCNNYPFFLSTCSVLGKNSLQVDLVSSSRWTCKVGVINVQQIWPWWLASEWNPNSEGMEARGEEDQEEFKIILNYKPSSRPFLYSRDPLREN